MLGSDRFAFETPNVIDPGDAAPSAPPRRASQQQQAGEDPASSQRLLSDVSDLQLAPDASLPYEDHPESQRFLDHTVGSNSTQRVGPQNNYAHHSTASSSTANPLRNSRKLYFDDPSMSSGSSTSSSTDRAPPGVEHSLPSVEEARTYAVSLLHSAEKTRPGGNSSSDPFARTVQLASPSSSGGGVSSSLGFGRGRQSQQNRQQRAQSRSSKHLVRRELMFLLAKITVAIVLMVLFIVLVVVCVKLAQSKSSSGYSEIPSVNGDTPLTRLEKVYAFLHNVLLTDPADLLTPGRPQYMASNWIANMDVLELDIPTALNTTQAQAFVQRYVLALLYYSTSGPAGWRNKVSFLSEQLECGWFDPVKTVAGFSDSQTYALGVTCNNNLEVVNLLLPSNGLKGSIPQEVGFLTSLTLLSMPHNQLDGQIPAEMANLVNLQYLDLKFNFLKGRIPNIFETVNELRVLGLSNNYLENELPPSIVELTKLKTLALDDNLLQGDLSQLNALTDLEYLYADRNEFSGQLDANFLTGLENLRELDLSGNSFATTTFPKHLLQHATLQILDLSDNDLQGELPTQLDENIVLEFLSVRDNELTGLVDPTSLPMLKKLNHLDIQGNLFQGQFPSALTALKNLTFLFMGNNPMLSSGPIPSWLFELKQLRELGMSNMKRMFEVPFWLEDMNELLFLDLSHNSLTGDVPRGVFDLPKLTYILLHNNSLAGEIPTDIVGGEKLQMMTLFDNGFSGDVDHVCAESPIMELLAVDCNGVTCSEECCPSCCDRQATAGVNAFCYSQAVPTYLQFFEGLWELNYTRAQHSFDPALITDDPENPIQATPVP